ncbi:MAG: hypothetical protein P8X96_07535 [Desulfobacteraceae bacterium]|jgi:hypothetical protein
MTAAGDAVYLPVPSSVKLPFDIFNRPRPYIRQHHPTEQHRIYRMPRQELRRMTYSAKGYAPTSPDTGKIIDIRV